MGPLAKFLLALTNLVRTGGIKKISDAVRFAEQQFGVVTPLLKKQIEKIFESVKKPVVGKPGKKEGTVLPLVRDVKKTEGIETLNELNVPQSEAEKDIAEIQKSMDDLDQTEAEADAFSESIGFPQDLTRLGIENLKNPKRLGGPLDPVQGITRTLVRRILDKKGIKIDRREDPIDIFLNKFGIDIGLDVQNLAEEIVEAEQIGRQLKPVDDLLEIEGFFNIEMPKNPNQGIPTDELIEQLEKDLEEKETLENFDPTFRKPNATGGLTRTSYAMGSDDEGEPIRPDPTKPINPFGPKPTGPVLPDKSKTASSNKTYMDYVRAALELGLKPIRIDEFESLTPIMDVNQILKITDDLNKRTSNATGGRVRAASGGLAEILKV